MSNAAVRVSVFGKSDLGRTRERNEDTFLVADLSAGSASLQPEVRQHTVGPRGSLFMVADGMGGAAAGEVASVMAADVIFQHLRSVWQADAEATAARFAYRLREAVELANTRLYTYAHEHPEVRGMGTTVTAAGVFASDLYLTQVGDSRAYLVRNEKAIQLTKDQSLMQRLIDAGEITEDEAARSDQRNIILQALGPDPRVKVDLTHQSLRRGDTLILCSDGLSTMVKKDEFARLVLEHPELPTLCSTLVDLANERGGQDNITVVAARFEGDGLKHAEEGSGGVGYEVYHLPEMTEPTTGPGSGRGASFEAQPPALQSTEPESPIRRGSPFSRSSRGLWIAAVLLALLVLLLLSGR